MGAYLRDRTEDEVEEALRLLTTDADRYTDKPEFLNIRAAELVLERFGMPTFMPSLGTVDERSLLNIEGIPTWHYGTEPSNVFATWHAKFFFNDVREGGLISLSNGGIIYVPGE